jgi:hypothetical protein
MGMPMKPVLDIMRRSMQNLSFVEAAAGPSGPYEVTQLINTFLGALVHPYEVMQNDLDAIPVSEAETLGWPAIVCERTSDSEPSSIGDLIRLMRNGVAHGNIEFLPAAWGEIHAIRIWNVHRGRRTWGAIVTIKNMRRLLAKFVVLIEERHRDFGSDDRSVA